MFGVQLCAFGAGAAGGLAGVVDDDARAGFGAGGGVAACGAFGGVGGADVTCGALAS